MPNCEIHGTYFQDGQMCGSCWRMDQTAKIALKKQERKQFGRFGQRRKMEVSEKTKRRQRLLHELQRVWSRYMKHIYREMGVYYCWIGGNVNNASGLSGLHVSHYFPKGELWQLWCDPVNSGLSSFDYNVNKPETVGLMRRKMVEVWGPEAIADLEDRAEMYRQRIAAGMDPRRPTDIWIIGMIKEVKSKTPKA